MKTIFALLALAMLAGCAGLNVQWAASISYNTQALTYSVMQPGKTDEQK